MEIPILVKRFLDEPMIQDIEFTKLCVEYPKINNLLDFYYEEIQGNRILGYSEK